MNEAKQLSLKIAVVGDVHDQWENADAQALHALGVDLVLFVGDFGNESIPVVEAIAALDLPKVIVLGNHDCWYTASPWGRKKCPYDRQLEDRVNHQLQLLGETHVGFNSLDFPQFQLSVVGARPFSWGGPIWQNGGFYQERYGVNSFTESANKIIAAAQKTAYETVIFIGHCGPQGLGNQPEDICGKDWNPLGGDFGEPDFRAAISATRQQGKQIPLVTFGHMHHRLRHTQAQLREAIAQDNQGTLYLNAARVPRIITTDTGKSRNFSLVTLENHIITQASLIWVNEQFKIETEEILYSCGPSVVKIGYTNQL
ncbi:TIGR04168 family protein [Roseofilum sp. BLCC_M154]|uniref:TIGR04168 family protein n=1 Tax=Roseofilum acuticapitatum BLCC-M154 TaxID=3022444 RepID=A0ABT7AZ38_9CYAN|nr:TIGR04168 family protein [Roseofilum acuticapitatum]MDJ1172172.1 TIGR04168 family protein [Roseofilum acuticapitatum BLCC-M154]